jgi:hypothetical protein
MANYVAVTGIIDQVGGSIKVPASTEHIPRYQGNFFTLPSGLEIKGNRKFIWSVDTSTPGVVGITNEFTSTPTIEFNSNVYSQANLKIKCTIIGQPKNFIEYILYTVSTSVATTAFHTFSTITDNNFFNVTNIGINIENNSSLITENNSYVLSWAAPAYSQHKVNYLIEIWNEQWEFFGITSNTNISINNPLTSYRIKAVFLNSEVQSEHRTFGISYNDLLLLNTSRLLSQISGVNILFNFNQNLNSNSFFSSVEAININSSILTELIGDSIIFNFNQNIAINSFFSSVDTASSNSTIESYILDNNIITGFNQNPSNNIFWTQAIGT